MKLRAIHLGFLISGLCFPGLAQIYFFDWFTFDGGGVTSSAGICSVTDTMEQHNAGPAMTDGQHSVTGGFRTLTGAVQTEGAPTLRMIPAEDGRAQISWMPPSTRWNLRESLSLSPAAWTNSTCGFANPIVVPATLPTKFYPLLRP